ncbi:hypothetical protein [Acidisoma sp. 7E03]
MRDKRSLIALNRGLNAQGTSHENKWCGICWDRHRQGPQTYISGRLWHQIFFSLVKANESITGVIERLNGKVMRRFGISRRNLFETIERSALATLPGDDYVPLLK